MCIGKIHALLGKRIHIGSVNRGFSVHRIGTTTQIVNGDKEHIGLISFFKSITLFILLNKSADPCVTQAHCSASSERSTQL